MSAENPKKPYSDSDIVDLLKKSGISIARRTVAKYQRNDGRSAFFQEEKVFLTVL